MNTLPDHEARQQALDVRHSFIVQAPAGSGKTELLSLRYLGLLGTCEEPEEVLAITFTRKAASEMKDRIIAALRSAAGEPPTDQDELRQRRYQTARAVLDRDRQRNWQLLNNPARLRIQTIDSFCLNLATRIPLLSQVGGVPNLSDDVTRCFSEAVRNTLSLLNSESDLAADIVRLLTHLDNDVGRVERLLFVLLGSRDQWLSYVMGLHSGQRIDRDYLEAALEELIDESLAGLRSRLLPQQSELVELVNFAAGNLPIDHPRYPAGFQPLSGLPDCRASSLEYWRLLEFLLLTQSGPPGWRARITAREGFPAEIKGDKGMTAVCRERKATWAAVLNRLREQEDLLEDVAYLRLLPDPALEDRQWEFLTALARILARLSSELLLAFQHYRQVDHAQVAAAAFSALGPDDEPTDLALALDHRLRHILVDEFQDTSRLQTDLLSRLTAGWEPADGRTLFLVGDAMQSVYGFRNANVGIYLNVRAGGLGDIALTPLTLTSNFRSQARVVDWVNRIFSSAFPDRSDPSRGAVPYSASVASKAPLVGAGISVELISHEAERKSDARQCEAQRVAARILDLQSRDPDASIAILVRSRSQLSELIPALRAAGIHWQATDIDRMASLPVIDDLQSLTRALLNLGDRIAWLAILRAPWCGLSLADLHAIATWQDASIWSTLENYRQIDGLSADGRERLEHFVLIMAFGLRHRFRTGLRAIVEALWTMLGGAALTGSVIEQASVAHYLTLLEQHETGGSLRDIQDFDDQVANAFLPAVNPASATGGVQILTMHKAKGLEFDHVILPCLAAGAKADDKPLLQWHERINQAGEARLFMAALSATGRDDDPLYRLIRYEQSRKARYEQVRLLYIAVTRARKSAHLSATLSLSRTGEAEPPGGSLLSYIWTQLQESDPSACSPIPVEKLLTDQSPDRQPARIAVGAADTTPIRRFVKPLRVDARTLALLEGTQPAGLDPEPAQLPENSPDQEPEATIGILIHQALENVVQEPDLFRNDQFLPGMRRYWRQRLDSLIGEKADLDAAVGHIEASVRGCIEHRETAWLFNPGLAESAAELPVSRNVEGTLFHYLIDRTFVDPDNVRWIVDYKSAVPDPGSSEEAFIARQISQHRPQLDNYRRLFNAMESRPVKTALLLTAIPRLVEIPAD
ncbi:MAG: UvrD-helicase domain-containing protein [Gammaproteobacteria bacterium]|nr:UvrD-helicase domain-containing protein [Pseudomonadales bacterium]MCP5346087.1 UvrD-helicase domain-containing protein [Pseudomonadales bacterium]